MQKRAEPEDTQESTESERRKSPRINAVAKDPKKSFKVKIQFTEEGGSSLAEEIKKPRVKKTAVKKPPKKKKLVQQRIDLKNVVPKPKRNSQILKSLKKPTAESSSMMEKVDAIILAKKGQHQLMDTAEVLEMMATETDAANAVVGIRREGAQMNEVAAQEPTDGGKKMSDAVLETTAKENNVQVQSEYFIVIHILVVQIYT